MPNQHSQTVGFGEIQGVGFGQNSQTFMIPIYSTTVLYIVLDKHTHRIVIVSESVNGHQLLRPVIIGVT